MTKHCLTVTDPGQGPGRPGHPLFLDQTEARRAEQKCFGNRAPPSGSATA